MRPPRRAGRGRRARRCRPRGPPPRPGWCSGPPAAPRRRSPGRRSGSRGRRRGPRPGHRLVDRVGTKSVPDRSGVRLADRAALEVTVIDRGAVLHQGGAADGPEEPGRVEAALGVPGEVHVLGEGVTQGTRGPALLEEAADLVEDVQATSFAGTATSAYRSGEVLIRIPEFVRTVTPTQASPASANIWSVISQMTSRSAPPEVSTARRRPTAECGRVARGPYDDPGHVVEPASGRCRRFVRLAPVRPRHPGQQVLGLDVVGGPLLGSGLRMLHRPRARDRAGSG